MSMFSPSLRISVCCDVYFFHGSWNLCSKWKTAHADCVVHNLSSVVFLLCVCGPHSKQLRSRILVMFFNTWRLVFAKETQKIYVDLYLTQQVHIHKIFLFFFCFISFIQRMDFCELKAVLIFSSSQVWENRLLWNYITSPLTKLERCQWQLWGTS